MANVRVLVVLSVIVLSSTVFSVHAAIKTHSDADKEETLEELVEKLRSYVHKVSSFRSVSPTMNVSVK